MGSLPRLSLPRSNLGRRSLPRSSLPSTSFPRPIALWRGFPCLVRCWPQPPFFEERSWDGDFDVLWPTKHSQKEQYLAISRSFEHTFTFFVLNTLFISIILLLLFFSATKK